MGQAFKDVSAKDTKLFLKIIDKNDNNQSFNKNHIKMMIQYLSFMPTYEHLVCEDYSSQPYQIKHYLWHGDAIYPMEYSANPWVTNDFQSKNLDLNEQNIDNYIRFYFDYFISGTDTLKPIKFTDEIQWQDEISPTLKQNLEKNLLMYPQIEMKKDNFLVKMPCVFRQSIMVVTFDIDPEGRINIENRESLIDDLPIKQFP